MNRFDAYFLQDVSEADVDAWFDAVENSVNANQAALGLEGLALGGDALEHSPQNLTVNVDPLVAYDSAGRRIETDTIYNADLSVDENSDPTAVVIAGEERWVSLFVRYERALTDPRLDGSNTTVYYNRADSVAWVVAMGASATIGSAARPSLRADHVLVCDTRLVQGQTSIVNAGIDTTRTQYAVVTTGSTYSLRKRTLPEALQELEDQINSIVAGTLAYAGGPAWADGTTNPATTVEAQLDIILALGSSVGATRIGMTGVTGFAPDGSAIAWTKVIDALGFVNGLMASGGAGKVGFDVGILTWAGGAVGKLQDAGPDTIRTALQLFLENVIADLADATSVGADGASRIGFAPGGNLAATNTGAAIRELDTEKVTHTTLNPYNIGVDSSHDFIQDGTVTHVVFVPLSSGAYDPTAVTTTHYSGSTFTVGYGAFTERVVFPLPDNIPSGAIITRVEALTQQNSVPATQGAQLSIIQLVAHPSSANTVGFVHGGIAATSSGFEPIDSGLFTQTLDKTLGPVQVQYQGSDAASDDVLQWIKISYKVPFLRVT
jgi:hypothetical protein